MQNKNVYTGVQSLRFLAAMLVVVAHATGMVGERMYRLPGEHFWRPGMAGVDIFFVISGFVMALAAEESLAGKTTAWRTFLLHRLVRVVPMYWLATTFKLIFVLAIPSMAITTSVEFWHVVSSYVFYPTFNSDGKFVLPLLKVGWTLNYEMMFYLLFAAALFCRLPILMTCSILFGGCSIPSYFFAADRGYWFAYLNPILLEFTMGMFVAKFCRIQRSIGIGVILSVLCVCFGIIIISADLPIWWRWLFWGLPSMIIVGIVVSTENVIKNYIPDVLSLLGNSSYSLYITHTLLIPIIGSILMKFNFYNAFFAVTICLLATPIAGVVTYLILEKPLTQYLRRRVKNS